MPTGPEPSTAAYQPPCTASWKRPRIAASPCSTSGPQPGRPSSSPSAKTWVIRQVIQSSTGRSSSGSTGVVEPGEAAVGVHGGAGELQQPVALRLQPAPVGRARRARWSSREAGADGVAEGLLGVGAGGAGLGDEGEQAGAEVVAGRVEGGAGAGGAVEHLVGVEQRREAGREAVGDRGARLLGGLDRLPGLVDRLRVAALGALLRPRGRRRGGCGGASWPRCRRPRRRW